MSLLHLKHDRAMMKATLLVERSGENDLFTEGMVNEVLGTSGVHAGLNETAIAEMVANQWFDVEIVVAEGQLPVHGENGRVDYQFDPHPKITPTILPNGSVDYASINVMQKVVIGQILARLNPPTQGTAGFDLNGTLLPAVPGKATQLGRGLNTSYADAGATLLKSDVNGHVRLNKDYIIEVATVYEVRGDVNYMVGNIDFEGDVIIRGDVLSGFKIVATGEIEVGGVVEDAEIRAGGSVLVRAGFIGSGKGVIRAEVNVAVRYVHHQRIIAGSDIIVSTEAMDARLTAGRSISVRGTPGLLAGGTASAGQYIECNTLGNERHTRTEVALTYKSDEGKALEETKEALSRTDKQLRKIKMTIERMEDVDQFVHKVSAERGEAYQTLYSTRNDLEEKLEQLHATLADLELKLQAELSVLCVKAYRCVYPGVNVAIAGSHLGVFEWNGKTLFKLVGGEVTPSEFRS